jgi:hypothetical protein
MRFFRSELQQQGLTDESGSDPKVQKELSLDIIDILSNMDSAEQNLRNAVEFLRCCEIRMIREQVPPLCIRRVRFCILNTIAAIDNLS